MSDSLSSNEAESVSDLDAIETTHISPDNGDTSPPSNKLSVEKLTSKLHTLSYEQINFSERFILPQQQILTAMNAFSALQTEVIRDIVPKIEIATTVSSFQQAVLGNSTHILENAIKEYTLPAINMVNQISYRSISQSIEYSNTIFSEISESARLANAITLSSVISQTEQLRLISNFTDSIQNFVNVNTAWEKFTPQFILPNFDVLQALALPWISSFFVDMHWIESLFASLSTLQDSAIDWHNLKGLKESIKKRLLAALRSVGLCFAPSMSEDLLYQIADILDSSGRRSTAILLVWNYYARNNHKKLQQTVEKWQDNPAYIKLWKSFLEPALRNHINGDYGMSICGLAPHIEGISSLIVQKNTLLPSRRPRRGQLGLGSTKDVILRALREVGDEINLENPAISIEQWVRVKSLVLYIEDVFCKDLQFESDYDSLHLRSSLLNRHGILHGIQISNATPFNSLRMFLLLDTMHDLLSQYIINGGKI